MHVLLSMYVRNLYGKPCKSQIKFACNKNIIKNPQTLQIFIFSGIRIVCWMQTRDLWSNIVFSDTEVEEK